MALVLHSYASPFTDTLQLAERLFTIDGKLLKIEQAWKGDGKGGTDIGFGASVYPAAYVLAEYLERHPYLVRGKRVIELGTGTGFLGIAAAVLGAAHVCLTDGDEASLKLTDKNVSANLPSTSFRKSSAGYFDHQQALNVLGFNAGPNGGSSGSVHNGISIGLADVADDGERPPPAHTATISVQKLRWGCAGDMQAAGCPRGGDSDNGSSRQWDVVLGSDIAALPYASSYGDLLRTIISLVNRTNGGAPTPPPRNISDDDTGEEIRSTSAAGSCEALDGGIRGGDRGIPAPSEASAAPVVAGQADRGRAQGAGRRRVVVLLAHKRRHVSEDAFFEDLKEALGGESSFRATEEDDIHPDFRGSGIRLHMFAVDG